MPFIENILLFSFNTTILLFVSFRATMSVLITFPLYIYSSFYLSKKLRKYSKKLTKVFAESSSRLR